MVEPTPQAPTAPAPAAGSPAASQPGTPATPSADAAKPDYLGDAHWDAEKKAPKVETLAADFRKLDEARQADEQRKASLPKTAGDYKVELPEDVKLPEGWQIDPKDKAWIGLAEFAHKNGLSQDQFKQGAKLYTEVRLAEAAARVTAAQKEADAQTAKLGDNGKARIQAVHTFIDGAFGDKAAAIKNALGNSEIVEAFEAMQGKLASAGITSFNTSGREPEKKPGVIEGYDKMSFGEKWKNRTDVKRSAA